MLAYNDIGTYTYVFLFDSGEISQDFPSETPGFILTQFGFRNRNGVLLDLDLKSFTAQPVFSNPTMLSFHGGEAFLECKLLERPAGFIELQLGSQEFSEAGLFNGTRYTAKVRDSLVTCVERLSTICGFHLGFAVPLGDDRDESDYREWFNECVIDSWFSLGRLVSHAWLSPHAIFVGPKYLNRHGKEAFLNCPAWKVSTPGDNAVCVFFDNTFGSVCYPSGHRRKEKKISYLREATLHLQEVLK